MISPRIKRFLFMIISIGIVLTALGGVLEITLRIFKISSDNFLKQDAALGWTNLSDKTGRSITSEYSIEVSLNRFGLRSPEYPKEKTAGDYRIAFIGDSHTEAFQVPYADSFVGGLEKLLNDSGKKQYQAFNFGITSYGTVKEAYVAEHKVIQFRPDLIVLAVSIGNDLNDNLTEQANPNASFSSSQRIKNAIKSFFRNHVASAQFLNQLWMKNAIVRSLKNDEAASGLHQQGMNIYKPISSDSFNQAVVNTENALQSILETSQRNSIPLIVVLIPEKQQIHPKFRSPQAAPDLDYHKPDRILAEFLKRKHIHYLDLLPFFEKWAIVHPSETLYYPRDGHMNRNGHRVLTENLYEYIAHVITI